MVTPVDSAWVWWADRLLAGSIQGGLAVLVVWLACRVLTLPPAMRAALWWVASLKLIAALIPLPTVALRLLPAPPSVALSDLAPLVSPSVIPVLRREAIVPSWLIVIIAVWSIGVLLHVIPLAIGLVRLARTVRDSTPVGPDDADAVPQAGSSTRIAHQS